MKRVDLVVVESRVLPGMVSVRAASNPDDAVELRRALRHSGFAAGDKLTAVKTEELDALVRAATVCRECGGSGTGPEYMNGSDVEQGKCTSCDGKGLAS